MEDESDGDINFNWPARYSNQRVGTGNGGLGNKMKSEDHPKDSIVEIGQNTKESPEDLLPLRLQLTLM